MFVPEQDRQSTAADLPHDAILCQVVWASLLLLRFQGELSRQRGCEACQTVPWFTPVGKILGNCGLINLVGDKICIFWRSISSGALICIKHATHSELWDKGTRSYPDLRFGLAITFSRDVCDAYLSILTVELKLPGLHGE